jgi:hypothetical protein
MSSRSLAAARARRAGDTAPPVSGNRPGTSIGSTAAFSNMPQPPNNVRVARQPMQQQQMPPQQQQYQQQMPQQRQQQQKQPSATFQQIQQQNQNSLPFSKLSISDAIGLITLRLGRVEQWVIETEHENESKDESTTTPASNVDNSVLVGLLNRLEAVEKKEPLATAVESISSEEVAKLTAELSDLNNRYTKFCDEANKQTLTISKHTEQLFRFERELIETKDILKTFMLKYDNFVQESNDKLADYEFAISEIEKSIAPWTTIVDQSSTSIEGSNIDGIRIDGILPSDKPDINSIINPYDLKNIVKQELSSIDA